MTTTLAIPVVGRRERKKLETRRRIRRAALELAQQRGVEHVTTDDISEAADISPRTFFNYFGCKEDALVADAGRRADELRETILARPAGEPALTVLRHALIDSSVIRAAPPERAEVRARYRLVRENPQLLPRHLQHFAAMEKSIETAMQERFESDDPATDLRPALLASIGVSVLRLATHRWSSDEQAGWTATVDTAFRLLEHGFD